SQRRRTFWDLPRHPSYGLHTVPGKVSPAGYLPKAVRYERGGVILSELIHQNRRQNEILRAGRPLAIAEDIPRRKPEKSRLPPHKLDNYSGNGHPFVKCDTFSDTPTRRGPRSSQHRVKSFRRGAGSAPVQMGRPLGAPLPLPPLSLHLGRSPDSACNT